MKGSQYLTQLYFMGAKMVPGDQIQALSDAISPRSEAIPLGYIVIYDYRLKYPAKKSNHSNVQL